MTERSFSIFLVNINHKCSLTYVYSRIDLKLCNNMAKIYVLVYFLNTGSNIARQDMVIDFQLEVVHKLC